MGFYLLKYDISFESVAKFKYFEGKLTIQNAKIRELQLSFGPESFTFLSAKPLKIKIYNTKMLPVLLYRCKTMSIKLNEEHGLRVFENRVLWKTFESKMDEVTADWRKLHDKEFTISNRVLWKTFESKMDEVTADWRKLHDKEFTISNPHQILFV